MKLILPQAALLLLLPLIPPEQAFSANCNAVGSEYCCHCVQSGVFQRCRSTLQGWTWCEENPPYCLQSTEECGVGEGGGRAMRSEPAPPLVDCLLDTPQRTDSSEVRLPWVVSIIQTPASNKLAQPKEQENAYQSARSTLPQSSPGSFDDPYLGPPLLCGADSSEERPRCDGSESSTGWGRGVTRDGICSCRPRDHR